MKKRTQILSLLLIVALLFSLLPTGVMASGSVTASGTCGENLTWQLTDDGTLTISGMGDMQNYAAGEAYAPWFSIRDSVKSVIIENTVTSIGAYAFSYCTSLTDITIPDSVTSIGSYAFAFCYSNLTNINIPDSVTSIGEHAFVSCSGLTDITIPKGVTRIYEQTFGSCTKLLNVTILGSVISIGDEAFINCARLTSINIPDSVTSIGDGAFGGCNLTDITISDSVIHIGDQAFANCEKLTSITIPDSVTTIEDSAFAYCPKLTEITFEGMTPPTIGNNAFGGVTATAYYPGGELWTEEVQQNYGGTLTWVAEDSSDSSGSVTASGTCGENLTWQLTDDGTLTISGTGAMFSYRDASEFPWYSNRSLITAIVIEHGLEVIYDSAFWDCRNLTSVTIPESVTSIGRYAFYQCTSLTSVIIPEGVTSIAESTFHYCINLASVTIPESVTSIGVSAFYDCRSLTSVTIPESVTYIDESAFYECLSLTAVYITNLKGWCEISFANYCSNPMNEGATLYINGQPAAGIVIPNGLTSIADYAFYGCASLTSIAIPEGVTSIGDSAFSNCSSLTDIIIPASVTSIGDSTFNYCTKLTSITIPNSVTNIDFGAFKYCSKLTSITIPDSVTSIGQQAFYNCTELTEITFEGMTPPTIGSNAFRYVTATAYYPGGELWTEEARQNYGGTLTWVSNSVNTAEIAKSSLALGNILELSITVELNGLAAEDHVLHVTVGEDTKYQTLAIDEKALIPAHRLYEPVTIELLYNGQIVDTEIWTMERYTEALENEYAQDEKMMDLLDTLSDYGSYAAYYADPNGVKPESAAVSAVERTDLASYKPKILTNHTALGAVTSLYLDDACDLTVKFNAAAFDGCTLYVDGVAVTTEASGDRTLYSISEILPQNWGKSYNIKILDANGTTIYEINYSVLSYAYAALGASQELQEGLNALLKAMYLYSQSAAAYANT